MFSKHATSKSKAYLYDIENEKDTLPETNSSHLKIDLPKRKQSYSSHPFSGAKVRSFREGR